MSNAAAPANMPSMVVTLLTSHLLSVCVSFRSQGDLMFDYSCAYPGPSLVVQYTPSLHQASATMSAPAAVHIPQTVHQKKEIVEQCVWPSTWAAAHLPVT